MRDPEWPLWYADYLQERLGPLLDANFTEPRPRVRRPEATSGYNWRECEPRRRAAGRRTGVSKRRGPRSEKERQQRELEVAGWELVERGGGKTIWRNPQSGRLYPQYVAITMVREGPGPKIAGEEPGDRA